ncbi:glycosyltransferase involved in cell wall biosynthesis [Algoriphagus iocasae]|uniref:Glycosyltransferase involved in cell wall biosynthesis n=1 Tax=Algoriphagus iocasae TaxID=1836499 RepID=A0A841MTJ6_9BACT|nr:glycosyltransferase family 2 protein [Algoriphagus iocasae]MBB6327954.1 glycosyltransferase involved in cell wall biosynthesis [Algoriphagus iocasae]
MKVSIITVTYNSSETVQDTINSIRSQDYPDFEYIIVDGKSSDATVDIINNNLDVISKWISEPDNGLYDAMNKGIKMATGDIVGIINSDDFYHKSDSISQIVEAFENFDTESVYADVIFVDPSNLGKTVRYYSSKRFALSKFRKGIMPAHPTFFTYRRNFEKYGYYKTDYKITADFELLVRFLYKYKLSSHYLPIPLMKMRTGGLSTKSWKSNIIINQEDLRACKENGLKTNYFWLYSRYFKKLLEYFPKLF